MNSLPHIPLTTEVNNLHTPNKFGLFALQDCVDLIKSEHKYYKNHVFSI
jgi:hypothetical protein